MSHRLVLPAGTVALLRHLVGQLVTLHDQAPADDPAWQRLYPSTTADPRLDRDLRDLVHPDLVDGRLAAFEVVGDILADADGEGVDVDLDDDQAVALLGVVNDVRLSLSARVDLPGLVDDDGELPDDLPEETVAVVELVSWLALLQDHVLASLAPESLDHQRDMVRAQIAEEVRNSAADDASGDAPGDRDPDNPRDTDAPGGGRRDTTSDDDPGTDPPEPDA